jgi:hypothetical protein
MFSIYYISYLANQSNSGSVKLQAILAGVMHVPYATMEKRRRGWNSGLWIQDSSPAHLGEVGDIGAGVGNQDLGFRMVLLRP